MGGEKNSTQIPQILKSDSADFLTFICGILWFICGICVQFWRFVLVARLTQRDALVPFDVRNFLEPAAVAFGARELGAQERSDQLGRQRRADDSGAQREDVHRIVLDALVRGEGVVAERGSDPGELVRRDRRADAAAANDHAALGAPVEDGARDGGGEVGIVVARASARTRRSRAPRGRRRESPRRRLA